MKRVEVCSLSLPLSSSLCGALPPSLLSSPPLSSQHQSVRTPSSLFLSHPLRALLPAGQTFFQSGRISSTSCKKLNKFTWKFNQEFFFFFFFFLSAGRISVRTGPRYGPQNACGCVRAGPGRTDGGLSPIPTPSLPVLLFVPPLRRESGDSFLDQKRREGNGHTVATAERYEGCRGRRQLQGRRRNDPHR